jgi:lipid A 4'-phosphatase
MMQAPAAARRADAATNGAVLLIRQLFYAAIVLIAVASAVLAVAPSFDLAVTRAFWAADQGFWLSSQGWAGLMRRVSMWPTIGIGIAALVSLIQHMVAPASRQFMSARAALFLFLTITAAPVLLVNGVLKEHWERARPVHVTEFGGQWRFTPWWRPGDGTECRTNCSFISGESSGAAWLAAPALLAPPAARPAALGAVAVYTAIVSSLRIAFGGHFLSDTLIAVLVTLIIIAWAHYWLIRRSGAADEAAVAARLARIGAPLRRLVGLKT